jgi:hypothetical protein
MEATAEVSSETTCGCTIDEGGLPTQLLKLEHHLHHRHHDPIDALALRGN